MKQVLILLILLSCVVLGQESSEKSAPTSIATDKSTSDCRQNVELKYVVFQNTLHSAKIRSIEVFLDPKDFSEANLTILFTKLAEKNPEPIGLNIEVKTNWAQVPSPTDCPIYQSNMSGSANEFDYHFATFYRRDRATRREYFEYNPVLKSSDLKTVVLK